LMHSLFSDKPIFVLLMIFSLLANFVKSAL
jgi:hypothetical protein